VARIRWNTAQVANRLKKLDGQVRRVLKDAALEVGGQVLNDAVNEPPTVAKADPGGRLRRSGSVEAEVRGGRTEATVGFNTEYAAVMHEGRWETGPLAGVEVRNWTTPGSGPHFLSSKLQRHRRDYLEGFADAITRRTGMR